MHCSEMIALGIGFGDVVETGRAGAFWIERALGALGWIEHGLGATGWNERAMSAAGRIRRESQWLA